LNCIKSLALTAALLLPGAPVWGGPAFFDDFENGLDHWQPRSEGDAVIVEEPGTGNHVLEITPREDSFSHILLRPELPHGNLRMEGRFKFPTQGDGYLGLIYNYRPGADRTDFGVLYIKSNGSYVRVSPHYDDNPSWRLYPELETPLPGPRQLETGVWYAFRLDVQGRYAALFIDDFSEPVVQFNAAPNDSGTLGLEARPGFGEPAWVDKLRCCKASQRRLGCCSTAEWLVIQFLCCHCRAQEKRTGPQPALG
jgi:hypothetical protein